MSRVNHPNEVGGENVVTNPNGLVTRRFMLFQLPFCYKRYLPAPFLNRCISVLSFIESAINKPQRYEV